MGILAILAAIVLVALNPARHFAQARNTQRSSDLNAILNAVSENMADNKGIFTCNNTNIPVGETAIASNGGFDLASCVVPTYLSSMPYDPASLNAHFTNNADYATGYTIAKNPQNGRITVSAPDTELSDTHLSVTR